MVEGKEERSEEYNIGNEEAKEKGLRRKINK
jgi:hypothetical protein